jgi:hypothetical protein
MLTTHGEPDQTSLRGVWVEGRYTIGTSWGTSEAPLFSQGLELPIFFYGGFYALYQRSSCCFPLGGKRLWIEQTMVLGFGPCVRACRCPHRHGSLDQ